MEDNLAAAAAAEEVESAVEILQRNDPATTTIEISLLKERSNAEELAQALAANDFIVWIRLELQLDGLGATDNNWSALLNVIATREKLDTVQLVGRRQVAPPRRRTLLDASISPLLQAIQRNHFVRKVAFHNMSIKGEVLSSYLDGVPFLEKLFFGFFDIEP